MAAAVAAFAVSTLLLLGAGACLYWYARQRRLVRMIEATAVARIASAGPGYAALEGEARPAGGGPVRSTLTGTSCCWYRFRVERRASIDAGGGWTVIEQGTSARPFLLRDDSGVCAVGPAGADVYPTDRGIWFGETPRPRDRHPPRHRMTDVAAARALEPRAPGHVSVSVARREVTPSQYRYKEECIYPGDRLFVLGLLDGVGKDGGDSADSSSRQVTHAVADPGCRRRPYVISGLPRSELARLERGDFVAALVVGLLLAAAAAGVLIAWWKLR